MNRARPEPIRFDRLDAEIGARRRKAGDLRLAATSLPGPAATAFRRRAAELDLSVQVLEQKLPVAARAA